MNPETKVLSGALIFALSLFFHGCDATKPVLEMKSIESSQVVPIGEVVNEIGKNVWVIFQDSKGHYWFGTDGKGVLRYDGKTIIRYSTKDGLPNDRIRELKEDKSGNIFISTLEGICKFDGKEFKTLAIVKEDSAWRLHPDDLWFKGATNTHGPYRYDGKNLYLLKFPKHDLEDQINKEFPRSVVSPYSIYTIYQDTKGNLWFGTQHLGAIRYDGKSHTWIYERHLSEAENGGSFGIRTIGEDKSGRFWICSNRFRFELKPEINSSTQKIEYARVAGISHTQDQVKYEPIFFESMTHDDEGNLWMSSNGSGVWRYDGQELKNFPVMSGDSWLISVYKDRKGDIWMGTDSAGVFRFDGKSFQLFQPH